jgi:hypothetical protein
VGAVLARRRDDGAAQHAQQFRDGDRDQAYLQAGAGIAVQGDGDGQVRRRASSTLRPSSRPSPGASSLVTSSMAQS